MNPIERVLTVGVEIEGPRTQRIVGTSGLAIGPFHGAFIPSNHFFRGHPSGPAAFHPNLCYSRPRETSPSDTDSVTDSLAIPAYKVEKMRLRIDDDSSRFYIIFKFHHLSPISTCDQRWVYWFNGVINFRFRRWQEVYIIALFVVEALIARIWPARYFVPDAMRDYCMFDLSSRGMGFGAMVSGAGGL